MTTPANTTTGIDAGARYFQQCRVLGFSDAEIMSELVKAGWQQSDINSAMVMEAGLSKRTGGSNRWLWII